MTVTVKDKGWRLLKAKLDKNYPRVKVGIFGAAAAEAHKDSDGASVGQIAAAHEHGLGVPRRSWCGDTIDANQADIHAGLRVLAREVLDPKVPVARHYQALAQTGQHIAGLMRQRISAGISPALSPRYLPRKLARHPGATTPLIASGQMWGAIGSVVEGSPVVVANQKRAIRAAAKKAVARRRRERQIARVRKSALRAGKKASKSLTRASKRTQRAVTRASKRFARGLKRLTKTRKRRRK